MSVLGDFLQRCKKNEEKHVNKEPVLERKLNFAVFSQTCRPINGKIKTGKREHEDKETDLRNLIDGYLIKEINVRKNVKSTGRRRQKNACVS